MYPHLLTLRPLRPHLLLHHDNKLGLGFRARVWETDCIGTHDGTAHRLPLRFGQTFSFQRHLSTFCAATNMQLGSKTPKSELYEFFQLQPGMRQPTFDTQPQSNPPAVPDYLCKLTCPGIDTQGLPEKTFTGQARNKKTAEQNAAEQALNFLRQRDLMAPAMSHKPEQQMPHDLQEQLASIKMAPVSTGFDRIHPQSCIMIDIMPYYAKPDIASLLWQGIVCMFRCEFGP